MSISNPESNDSVRLILPDERLVAVDMRIDDRPYVGVLNSGLQGFDHKDVFGWLLSITIDYDNTIGQGMPDKDDTLKMQNFSDALSTGLAGDQNHPNVLLLGRITGDGYTEIMWYVNNPDEADSYLKTLIDTKAYTLDFSYEITSDPTWEEAAYWLQAL